MVEQSGTYQTARCHNPHIRTLHPQTMLFCTDERASIITTIQFEGTFISIHNSDIRVKEVEEQFFALPDVQ